MLQLEVVVVIVGLRSETNLLHHNFGRFGLLLLLPFLLLIEEFLIIQNLAYRRHCIGRNLDQIETLLVGHVHSFLYGVNTLLYIIADQTHLFGTDAFVDTILIFNVILFCRHRSVRPTGLRLWLWFFLHSDYHSLSNSSTSAFKFSAKVAIFIEPLSPSPCFLTETSPFSASFSPTMSK